MPDLKTIKAKAADADARQGTGGLLTRKVDAAAKAMMTHKVPAGLKWRMLLVVDASYSMQNEYKQGNVQSAVENALAFGVIVDDDGDVPVVVFDSSVRETVVKLDNFHGFVNREGIGPNGTTNLTKALESVAAITGDSDLFGGSGGGRGFFGRGHGSSSPQVRSGSSPAFVTIVTDGKPDDERTAEDAIRRLSYRPLFLKFLYVGNNEGGWRWLQKLDTEIPVGVPFESGGRLVDNVNAQRLDSLGENEKAFYDAMFTETPDWLTAARAAGLLV
jgi:uncharacterized protein YegL